jgi:hypothetical protein
MHASCLAPTTTLSSSIVGHASDSGSERLSVRGPTVAGVTRFDRPAGRSECDEFQRFFAVRFVDFLVAFFVDFFVDFEARFAAFAFAARAARALTRFCASLAFASGESGRRFFAVFFAGFARPLVTGGRPTAGLTSATSTPSPNKSRATIAAWY